MGCGGRPGRPTGRHWPAAPRFFSGAIQLDQLIQISSVFGKVQDSRSWFVDSYSSLAAWRDATDRLTSFEDHIRAVAQQQRAQDATHAIANSGVAGHPGQLLVSGLSVNLPAGLMAGETLLQNLSLQAGPGDTVFFKGPSGNGKSTLFRILAGIGSFSSGQNRLPDNAMFILQRPYFPDGTPRDALAYPQPAAQCSDDAPRQALSDAMLPQLTSRLEDHDA